MNEIICGDCLDVTAGIPDASIDMILTDQPFIGIDILEKACEIAHKRLATVQVTLETNAT